MNKGSNSKPDKAEKVLIKGGRVIDPQSKLNGVLDILIIAGIIQQIGNIEAEDFDGHVINGDGKIITPGLVDLHVHLREPGREDAETIQTGCRAAMHGGFTTVCCMPNTHPVIDDRSHVEFIKERSEGLLVSVHPIGAVTKGQKSEELTEMGDMVDAGAVGFSDDGYPVRSAVLMRRALEYAKMFNHPIIEHCEDLSLSEGGVMNEGLVSTTLGMKGIPSISEEVHVARDLLIAEYTGGPLHVAHVSTRGSVRLIREAKVRGVPVTAETCPHYLVMTNEAVRNYDTNTKMKPPLRTEADRQALIEGLKDGTIDVIASDHAPHTIEHKETEYDAAAFGIVGLETMLGLIMTHLVKKKTLTISQIIEKMSILPRKIVNIPENRIEEGQQADLTLIDPGIDWVVDKLKFKSKSKNSPFNGWNLTGRSVGVINNGLLHLNP